MPPLAFYCSCTIRNWPLNCVKYKSNEVITARKGHLNDIVYVRRSGLKKPFRNVQPPIKDPRSVIQCSDMFFSVSL